MQLRCTSDVIEIQSRRCQNTFSGGWMGGWLEKRGLKLTSAKVEVEVEAELGKNQF